MISGTTRLMNLSSISIRLFLNGFSNTLSTKVAFAWLPASSRAKATIGVFERLIVEQREERDLDRRVGARRRRRRKPGSPGYSTSPTRTPDAMSARRRPVDDHFGAAVIDVVMRRQHRDARRLEADLKVLASPCSSAGAASGTTAASR